MRVLLGWLLAVALVCPAAYALDQTDSAQMGNYEPEDLYVERQAAIVEQIATPLGVNAGVLKDVLVGQTDGTGVVAINSVLEAGRAGGLDAAETATVEFFDALFGTSITAATTNGASAQAVMNDVRAATGAVGVNTVGAGVATAMAIGGTGGQIDTRVNTIMAERRGMVERFGSDAGLASYNMNNNFANRVWASPFYTWQDMGEKDNHEGYDYKAWGVSVGYDRAFGPVTVGGAFTYSRGDLDVDNVNDDNTIDNYGFSLYANYYACNGFFATLSGGYNYGDNDMQRYITVGNAGWQRDENHTNTYWVGGKVGYDWMVNSNFTLTPSIGLYWSESKGSDYTSTGVMGNLNYDKITQKSLMLPIDLMARYRVDLGCDSSVTFKAHGGYAYNFKKDGASGFMNYGFDNSTVAINGAKPGRSSWNVGGGITYQRGRWDVGVDYRYDGRSKFDAHRISATLGVNF